MIRGEARIMPVKALRHHGGCVVCKQRVVELDDVVFGVEISNDVLANLRAKHKRVGTLSAGKRVIAASCQQPIGKK